MFTLRNYQTNFNLESDDDFTIYANQNNAVPKRETRRQREKRLAEEKKEKKMHKVLSLQRSRIEETFYHIKHYHWTSADLQSLNPLFNSECE